ncbi:hypothetical protein [Actibacterium mucosum]|nr:hypothetical protein [Actibacterium mucosum]
MKQVLIIGAVALATTGAARAEGDMREGLSLLEQGAQLFMRGLADEMEPALRELTDNVEPAMRQLMQQMEPAMQELLGMIDNLDAYHMPERLPNGDIIIRRKSPSEMQTLPEQAPDIEI